MRAVVITRPGGPEVLEVQERPTPIPRAGEILVRVRASAINRADLLQRQGLYPAPPGAPSDIPGLEYAGEVAGVSPGVARWKEGDRVFGITGGGAYAEFVTVDAETAAPIPDRLDWREAAAVPEAFITAHDALVVQARLQRDESVLIHAVGSGVGLAGVQIARAWGAKPFGTARTAEKVERAKGFGLVDGVVIEGDVEALVPACERWTSGKGIDVTLDLVGGDYLGATIRASALRGRIMLVGTVAGRQSTIPTGMVLGKRLTLRGTVLRARALEEKRAVTAAFAAEVVPLFEAGTLTPTIDSVFELGQAGAAHERVAGNASFGKVVLRVG
ncbi:MAG TPA: NAD(P)H-quinone oxidoreductase [Gemmatimonadaceae bacterium]